MNYSDLNLSINSNVKTFDFNGNKISVKQYLPINDKHDLVMTTLMKSKDTSGIFDEVKIVMHFALNLVYMYSDLEFSIEDRIDEADIYDKLKTNDLLGKILELIPKEEYNQLFDWVQEMSLSDMEYGSRAGMILEKAIDEIPKAMQMASEIIESFNPEQYQNVIKFAEAANGGRNIITNEPVEQE